MKERIHLLKCFQLRLDRSFSNLPGVIIVRGLRNNWSVSVVAGILNFVNFQLTFLVCFQLSFLRYFPGLMLFDCFFYLVWCSFYLVWCVKNSLNFFSEVMIWCSGACVHNFVWCDLCKLKSIVYMGLSCKVEKRFLIFKFSNQKFNSCQNSWKQWLVAHLSAPHIWILVFLIFLFLNIIG